MSEPNSTKGVPTQFFDDTTETDVACHFQSSTTNSEDSHCIQSSAIQSKIASNDLALCIQNFEEEMELERREMLLEELAHFVEDAQDSGCLTLNTFTKKIFEEIAAELHKRFPNHRPFSGRPQMQEIQGARGTAL